MFAPQVLRSVWVFLRILTTSEGGRDRVSGAVGALQVLPFGAVFTELFFIMFRASNVATIQ